MSVVQNHKDLEGAIEKTSTLAEKSFGNGDIFIEKFITNARHIEIQVFGFGAKDRFIYLKEIVQCKEDIKK